LVDNLEHWKSKSLSSDSESEEPETPAPFFSPKIENHEYSNNNVPPSFSIIPNSNPGNFQLETNFPLSEIDNLIIKNLLGVTVYEAQNLTSNIIQLQNSPAGQYFVVMILKNGNVLTRKMTVQR
jgi:hypothetical protein